MLVVNLLEGVTQPSGATGAVDQALDGLTTYKSSPPTDEVKQMVVVEQDAGRADRAEQMAAEASTSAEAVVLTRELSDGPPNTITPTYLAERAKEVADRFKLGYKVL